MFEMVDFSATPLAGEGEGDSTNLTLSINKGEETAVQALLNMYHKKQGVKNIVDLMQIYTGSELFGQRISPKLSSL